MSEFQAFIESNRQLTETVEGKVGEIDSKVEEAVTFFKSEVDKFYSVGNFKNIRKLINWIGDNTHFNYVLLHMEPSAAENPLTDEQPSGRERFGFAQYGEIFSGRITSGYTSLNFARFLFHSGRGYNDASSAKVETLFSIGLPSEPVIVRNFPHDGKLFRAIRLSPMSSQWAGLSVSVSYFGDFRGTGASDRKDSNNKYWLKCVGIDKNETQPGEVLV
ncbi:hypothetical protein CGT72_09865 [Vibrio cholerae]|uniref:hypothetical protein n=1 Tax=Vibrio cholerae TaxID=666 RepID=UPI000BA908BD|nr:hypothetical protein [Vibrio cholerae]PAS33366.1 hypothetical protein CGT72_09865 [Vibrio cholerae]